MTAEGTVLLFSIAFLGPLLFLLVYFRDFLFRANLRGKIVDFTNDPKPESETHFIKCILQCKESLYIVAGLGNPEFYTRKVGAALREIAENRNGKEKGVKIRVIVGPILMLRDEDNGSEFITLFNEGKIELYVSKRYRRLHFRVNERGHVYYERHDPLAPYKIGRDFRRNFFEAKFFIREFKKLLRLPPSEIEECRDLGRDFICLRREQIEKLLDTIRGEPKEFDEYRIEELRELVRKAE
jgi:hypothetical protein